MSLILFAQNKGDPFAGLNDPGPMVFGIICVAAVLNLIMLGLAIWYLITMYKVFSAVSPSNRDMEPAMVFLVFVPLLGIVWVWLIMFRACSSLQKEYDDRGMSGDGDYGKTKGLVHLIGGLVCPPVGLVGLILYTLQMRKYLAELGDGGGGSKKKKIADDDDD